MNKKQWVCSLVFAMFTPLALVSPVSQAVTILNVEDPGITDVLFTGPTSYDNGNLGYSQAAGDFNGDGIDDLALGAPGMQSPQGVSRAGRVYLYYGGSGMSSLPGEVTTQVGLEDAMLFGTSIKERAGDMMTVGDFNNDGADDLVIVGQYGVENDGTIAVTRVHVVYGRTSLEAPITGDNQLHKVGVTNTLIERESGLSTSWPKFQVSAIATGDLNGDDFDDLIISDKVHNEFRILMGQSAKWVSDIDLERDTDFVLIHSLDDPNDVSDPPYFPLYNGVEIAGVAAGDLNGDGIDDLAVGLPNEDYSLSVTDTGSVYVFFGGSLFNPAPDVTSILVNSGARDALIYGGKVNDKASGPLAMGKINGDIYADLIIGEPLSGRGLPATTGLGQVQVVYGSNTLSGEISLFNQANITLRLSGPEEGSAGVGRIGFHTGQAILAEDANGDGIDDIVISSPEAFFSNSTNGWVHMVYGSNSMAANYILDEDADAWFVTPEPVGPPLVSGRMGESLVLGDFDNDNRPDLGMGAPDGLARDGGFIPLLFKPASTASCSGYDAQVTTDYPFSNGDFLCVGDNTLTTIGAVTIESTATARFQSPIITLGNGFRVQPGAGFAAGI